ncbi:MAG: class I SAM-dependent methyltransferase [Verrucomicrobiota bacterium]
MFNSKIFLFRIKRQIDKLTGKTRDDFDWKLYNILYRGEMRDMAKEHTQILKEGDYTFKDNKLLKRKAEILPLHPNCRLLYETILQLNPGSVLELGCGGGDHLHNIGLLVKNIKLYGMDLSDEQLVLLRERHPDLNAEINQYDCTLPFPSIFPPVDIAYTQAVIMHIQTGNGHMVALSNLFRVAAKQVVLMENWTKHEFVEDIKKLHALKVIPWKEIYFYYRDSEEYKTPHLMIVSSFPLQQYKQLTDFAVLRES